MSEFNRIVGVNGTHDFPEPVRKKIFTSSESSSFKTGIINEYKGLIDTSVNAAKSESKTRDDALDTKVNAEVTKINNKINSEVATINNKVDGEVSKINNKITGEVTKITGEVTNLDSKKMDSPSGGKPGDVLTFDGQKSVWSKQEREVPAVGVTGHVLTKTENGVAWSNAPSPNVIWTKDLQAKAQGFWIVNSTEPPEKPYYTCADGTVVPVIWHQPIEVLIPAVPTRPYFYPDDTKIGVENHVGLDYYIETYNKDGIEKPLNRKLLPGENDLSSISELPFSVKVVVKPRVGYKLPADFVWNMYYPDPDSVVSLGVETFDNIPNGGLLLNRQFGESGKYWMGFYTKNSTISFPVSEDSDYYNVRVNAARDGVLVGRVYDGVFKIVSTKAWAATGVETLSDKMRVTININSVPSTPNKKLEISLCSALNDIAQGIQVSINTVGNISGAGGLIAKKPIVPGVYTFESAGDRLSVTYPDGEKFVRSIPRSYLDDVKNRGNYGKVFAFRNYAPGFPDNDTFEIDYVGIVNYGV